MLAALDWKGQEFYHYLAVGSAVVVVLAVALYAVPGGKLKVPAIVLSLVGGVGLGAAAGVIYMGFMGYQLKEPPYAMPNGPPPGMGGANAIIAAGGAVPREMGGGPNYKNQLASLVSKLDVLSEKPLTARLSAGQKKDVEEQLKGLGDTEHLSEDEAKAKLDKLHEALKGQKGALETAGYRWPGGEGGGGRGFGGASAQANPFKSGPDAEHLKALTERLDKGEGE